MLRTTAAEGTKGDTAAAARIDLAEGTDIAAAENPAEELNIEAISSKMSWRLNTWVPLNSD